MELIHPKVVLLSDCYNVPSDFYWRADILDFCYNVPLIAFFLAKLAAHVHVKFI